MDDTLMNFIPADLYVVITAWGEIKKVKPITVEGIAWAKINDVIGWNVHTIDFHPLSVTYSEEKPVEN